MLEDLKAVASLLKFLRITSIREKKDLRKKKLELEQKSDQIDKNLLG